MLYGEGVVLRLLDKERMKFDLRTVGMPDDVLNQVQRADHDAARHRARDRADRKR